MFSAFQSNAFQNNAFQIVADVQHLSGSGLIKKDIDNRLSKKWIAKAYKKRQEQELAEAIALEELKQNEILQEAKQKNNVVLLKEPIEFNDTFITDIEQRVNEIASAVDKIKLERTQRLNKIRLLLLLTH